MLGEELSKARVAAGLTQEQLSFKAGVHRTYVSMPERDLKSATLDTLFLICDALGIAAGDLVHRVDQARKKRPRP